MNSVADFSKHDVPGPGLDPIRILSKTSESI